MTTIRILSFLLVLPILNPIWGVVDENSQTPPRGTLLPDQFQYRPSIVPDRIVLSLTETPSTSIAVNWRTNSLAKHSFAEIAEATDGPAFANNARTITGTPEAFSSNANLSHRHALTLDRLKPETLYVYRVGDGTNWSEWSQFKTASARDKPFRFVYFGDAQNSLKAYWSRLVRQAYSDAPKAAFFLHAGDLVNTADRDSEWGEWFYSTGFIHRSLPSVVLPGNHEYNRGTLSPQWKPTFHLPKNGPKGMEETCYFVDYQGVRIIALNSNEKHQQQAEWLEDVLSRNTQKWTLVSCHHPIHSSKKNRDNKLQRDLWQPIFDKYKVALVMQGHDHTYFRTGMLTKQSNIMSGVSARSDKAGTVYVVSVSGPKMYDLEASPFMARKAEDTQLYQVIDIDGNELRYSALTATGRQYDAFTISRDAIGNLKLRNNIPDSPENLRPKNR